MQKQLSFMVERILEGDQRAVARGLSVVESGGEIGHQLIHALFGRGGNAQIIGVTGPPGAGKSTLVNQIATRLATKDQSVGVLAVDPSSPFTGGAILGDRIRMADAAMADKVFVRSLASRGHLGGLSVATFGATTILDAAGYDTIVIETVGAGQSEVEIMQLAHSVTVVLAPGLGDDIQAIKAGILEIGDIFVINKADHPRVDQTVRAIRSMLSLGHHNAGWRPPIIKTVATTGHGIVELLEEVDRHFSHLNNGGGQDKHRGNLTEHLIEMAVLDVANKRLLDARQDKKWSEVRRAIDQGVCSAQVLAQQIIDGGCVNVSSCSSQDLPEPS